MGKLSRSDHEKILEILRELYSLKDPIEFPAKLLVAMARLVRAKSLAFTEVDPVLGKSTGCFHPPEPWHMDQVAEAFQRNIADHPVIAYAAKTRDGSARAISDFFTAAQFRSTGLYREVFQPAGLVDQLSIGMVGSAGLMIGISFNRARRGFSPRDREVLNALRPHVLQAYLNCRELGLTRNSSTDRHRTIIDQLPVGLACVNSDGRLVWKTDTANNIWCRHYPDAVDSIHGLPDAVRQWLKRFSSKARRAGAPSRVLVSLQNGVELQTRYCPLADGRAILLLQEVPSATKPFAIDDYGFTPREQQVAREIMSGARIEAVAATLEMSHRTVQKHLERVFRKLGVDTRAAACVKLLQSN